MLTEKLMACVIDGTTAMNRPTPASRMPAVRAALGKAKAKNYSWSLIAAIAQAPAE
jgi:hypothetical protein